MAPTLLAKMALTVAILQPKCVMSERKKMQIIPQHSKIMLHHSSKSQIPVDIARTRRRWMCSIKSSRRTKARCHHASIGYNLRKSWTLKRIRFTSGSGSSSRSRKSWRRFSLWLETFAIFHWWRSSMFSSTRTWNSIEKRSDSGVKN